MPFLTKFQIMIDCYFVNEMKQLRKININSSVEYSVELFNQFDQ